MMMNDEKTIASLDRTSTLEYGFVQLQIQNTQTSAL
jgi:hypothetical protein